MSKAGGRTALMTSALIVAGIRMWSQLRGKSQTPFSEWAIGWGATFFILSLLSEVAPTAAGSLSLIVAFSDFLKNGVSLTTDISSIITNAQGNPAGSPGQQQTTTPTVFVQHPFAPTTTTAQNGRKGN